jgi:Flp pilus assembly protein TadG
MLRSFINHDRGGVLVVFGLFSFVLAGAAAAALDYGRLTKVKAELNSAVDAAALAAAQATSDRDKVAANVFAASFRAFSTIDQFNAFEIKQQSATTYRVEARSQVPMTAARVLGLTSSPVFSFAEVMIGSETDILVSLVLDTTGSMKGARLTALKDAATNMVNTLYGRLKRSNQVKMAVVPFARYVNVGTKNRKQPWMSVPDDYSVTTNVCSTTKPVTRTYNCRTVTRTVTNDGVQSQVNSQVCDYEYGPPVTTCGPKTTNYKWNGCAGSRAAPLDTKDELYAIPVPGILNVSCPPALVELTPSQPTILTAIKNLTASDETYIPAGLMWGWRTLSPKDPFNEKTDAKNATQRYMIVMTDGVNTVSPTYPRHDGSNGPLADTISAQICKNVKADDVTIFTIAFEVTDATVKNMLESCASRRDKFFDAKDADQLSKSFLAIADQMTALRLTK